MSAGSKGQEVKIELDEISHKDVTRLNYELKNKFLQVSLMMSLFYLNITLSMCALSLVIPTKYDIGSIDPQHKKIWDRLFSFNFIKKKGKM